ncbi:hydroxyethylthiazole kinase [Psychromonas sp. CNPT3]|uniref:hydroxyethylthiazole kinase n=1 Tax=Psychromonas sp. CNPT3 TaxID=314282 RepID=UPI00006E425E|nr:hydroxyethylthiazole kinase [Psychromonas sp. CNPT3]AGH81065.1 hydroxyethylthiazole kinase [Psychromonas sp. CNPT3]
MRLKTEKIVQALALLRAKKPLVLNITNYVVMNNTANALLAIGASPIMAHSRAEMIEMVGIAGAVVINIGTIDEDGLKRMLFAVQQANIADKWVVLDPVGCGASVFRTQSARQIVRLANKLIIRANASEIIALAGYPVSSKGVDSVHVSLDARSAALELIASYACQVVISGETDVILDGANETYLRNGAAMMASVTGMGCTLSALTGAFAAIGETTGLAATAILGVAGEIAAMSSKGPGSLQVNLLDELYALDAQKIGEYLKIS